MSKACFVWAEDTFLWTNFGLLQVKELTEEKYILGLDRAGKPSWSNLVISDWTGKLIQIITDSSEIKVGKRCGLYTVEGLKKVMDLSELDIVETANVTTYVLDVFSKLSIPMIRILGKNKIIND